MLLFLVNVFHSISAVFSDNASLHDFFIEKEILAKKGKGMVAVSALLCLAVPPKCSTCQLHDQLMHLGNKLID